MLCINSCLVKLSTLLLRSEFYATECIRMQLTVVEAAGTVCVSLSMNHKKAIIVSECSQRYIEALTLECGLMIGFP